MTNISYPYKKTNKAVFQQPNSVLTADNIYWKKLGLPVLVKEFGAIDYIDFSPVEPYYFAATCSVRVQVYDPITKVVAKNISKFVQAAYGATFRSDGRLLVAGSEDAAVKLFDVNSKNVLRVFTGHTAPVHRTFFTKDQVKILSCSDDKSIGVWDIATEEKIVSFYDHTDYVRAGATSPISPDIILSGGYDHAVKLYDCRSKETVLSVDHGSPVESTLFLPSGGVFISAGGTEIKVWDIFNGGKLLANITQHHKTVTTLRLASNNSRFVSASLDRHVKIFDISTFKLVHNIDFPNAILSMDISENDDTLAVGMIDGVISIRKRDKPADTSVKKQGLFKFAPDYTDTKDVVKNAVKKVVNTQSRYQQQCSTYMRQMQYSKALTKALHNSVTHKEPEATTAVLQEMLRQKVLTSAIGGLKSRSIGAFLRFCKKYLGQPRFTRTIIDAINIFVDVYDTDMGTLPEECIMMFKSLFRQLHKEIEVCKKICEVEGAICMLLSAGQTTPGKDIIELNDTPAPSSKAQKELVIDV